MRILAIDPSLRSNGLCIDDGSTWLIAPSDDLRGVPRLAWLRDEFEEVIEDYQPQLVMLENYAFGAGRSAHQVGEWGGILRLMLRDMGRQVVLVSPNALKSFATGKLGDKDEVKAAMELASGRTFRKTDESDAFALMAMALAFLGHPIIESPPERVKKLKKLPWPASVLRAVAA